MNRNGFQLWGAAALVLCGAHVALAQRGDEGGSRGLLDPSEAIRRLDSNADGRIEPREIPFRARRFIEDAARQAGLNPSEPIPVDKLVEALRKKDSANPAGETSGTAGSGAPSSPAAPATTPGSGAAPSGSPSPSSEAKAEGGETKSSGDSKSTSGVPGFGAASELAKPPGFEGGTSSAAAKSAAGSTSSFSRRGDSTSNGESSRGDTGKFRRYAESLLKQYDENKNGVLEREEWQRMRGDPQAADANKDNVLTLDELTARLARYSSSGGNEPEAAPGSSSSSGRESSGGRESSSGRGSESRTSDARPPVRFLSPTERLPKGLPDWFARNDVNADGQVAMNEFASAWSRERADEFARYDANADGFLTPAEVLAGEKKKTTK